MKTLAIAAAAAAALLNAVPASAQYYHPYNGGNTGALVGVQTGHVSVLNGGILNGGILNGNGVAVGNGSSILSGNAVGNIVGNSTGVLQGILSPSGFGLGLFNSHRRGW